MVLKKNDMEIEIIKPFGPSIVKLKLPDQIINDFLNSHQLNLKDINTIYLNRGPGSFAGIRNLFSIVKAFNLTNNIDYYCYSIQDFKGEKDIKYENIPHLCDKFNIKKNLINPIYLS